MHGLLAMPLLVKAMKNQYIYTSIQALSTDNILNLHHYGISNLGIA